MSDQNLLDKLTELCELLHVSVHRPRLVFRINNVQIKVGQLELNKKQATHSSWKMMPDEMETEINAIESRVRRLMSQYSVSFKSHCVDADGDAEDYRIDGIYLVPASRAEDLLTELNSLNTELRNVVRDWTSNGDRFRNAVLARLGADAYELAKGKIPSLKQMLQTTRITAVSIPFGSNQDRVHEAGNREFLRQARERTSQMVEQVTMNLFYEPRRELAEVLDNLSKLISNNGRVRENSLNPVRRALDKLRMFDMIMDDDLNNRITELMNIANNVAMSEQNLDVATNNGLLAALRSVIDTALDEETVEQRFKVVTGVRRISPRHIALAKAQA